MNKIIDEIIYDIRKNNLFFLVLTAQITVCMVISFVTSALYTDTAASNEKVQKGLEGVSYHQIYDNLVEDYEKQFFSMENYLSKLKNMYVSLLNDNRFEYLEIYMQPVELNNVVIPETFLYGYERGDEGYSIRDSAAPDGKVQKSYNVKCCWISQNVQNSFGMACSEGRPFRESDFTFDPLEMPVILGADYKGKFKIGDVISGNIIIQTPINLKVIGFLKKGSYVYHHGSYENLNRYIVLPSVNMGSIPETHEEIIGQKILYLMKINGTLKSNRSLEELQVAINEICKSSQISPGSYVDGAPNIQSYMLNAGIKEIQTFIHMLSLLLLLFSFITLFLYTILKIEKNLKYYAILQLSGFSLREICEVVIGDIVTILLISDLISIFVSQVILALLGAKAAYMGMFIMINAGIFASTIITVIYKFKHYELIEFLREE